MKESGLNKVVPPSIAMKISLFVFDIVVLGLFFIYKTNLFRVFSEKTFSESFSVVLSLANFSTICELLILICSIFIIHYRAMIFKGKWGFSTDETFFSLNIVKFIVVVFSLLFFITSLSIASNVIGIMIDKNIDFPSEYVLYERVWKYFKAPISILLFLLPVLGLMAANHRSAISNRQIAETEKQNIFHNHYKHIEEFIDYMDVESKAMQKKLQTNLNLRDVHAKVFNSTWIGKYCANDSLLENVEKQQNEFYLVLPEMDGLNCEEAWAYIVKIAEINTVILASLDAVTIAAKEVISSKSGGISDAYVADNINKVVSEFKSISKLLMIALKFDNEYIPTKAMKNSLNLSDSGVEFHNNKLIMNK